MTRLLRRIWNRLLGSFFGRRGEGDLADELDCHIQFLAEENIRRGLPPEEAHRRARLTFGSVESAKEDYRDQRGLRFLDTTAQDLRYAFRGIRKNPGFAAIAILSLAIGIGANTAIFSLVDSVLLRPLAFKEPQRLFAVRESTPRFRVMPVNPMHAREWAKRCPSLHHAAGCRSFGLPHSSSTGSRHRRHRGTPLRVGCANNVFGGPRYLDGSRCGTQTRTDSA